MTKLINEEEYLKWEEEKHKEACLRWEEAQRREPIQEPIAHIKQGGSGYPVLIFNGRFEYDSITAEQPDIPLYSHPKEQPTAEHNMTYEDGFAHGYDAHLADYKEQPISHSCRSDGVCKCEQPTQEPIDVVQIKKDAEQTLQDLKAMNAKFAKENGKPIHIHLWSLAGGLKFDLREPNPETMVMDFYLGSIEIKQATQLAFNIKELKYNKLT